MSPPVHEVRNAIRAATGRFERELEASFTKEELQAICEALKITVDEAGRPSTTRMRRQIRGQVGIAESLETADGSPFRKAELQVIADGVGRCPSRSLQSLDQCACCEARYDDLGCERLPLTETRPQ